MSLQSKTEIVFVNPFQDPAKATHKYDNFQSALTYITRHWKCSRTRAREIFQAVNQGTDISDWPESEHAKSSSNKSRGRPKQISSHHSSTCDESLDEVTLDGEDISSEDKCDDGNDNNDNNDNEIKTSLATLEREVSFLRTEISQVLSLLKKNMSHSEVPSSQILNSVAKATALGLGESIMNFKTHSYKNSMV